MGHIPFKDIDKNLGRLVADGLRTDLSVIDDEAVRALISTYLEAGEPGELTPKMIYR
jgi:hypothetical protein